MATSSMVNLQLTVVNLNLLLDQTDQIKNRECRESSGLSHLTNATQLRGNQSVHYTLLSTYPLNHARTPNTFEISPLIGGISILSYTLDPVDLPQNPISPLTFLNKGVFSFRGTIGQQSCQTPGVAASVSFSSSLPLGKNQRLLPLQMCAVRDKSLLVREGKGA